MVVVKKVNIKISNKKLNEANKRLLYEIFEEKNLQKLI